MLLWIVVGMRGTRELDCGVEMDEGQSLSLR